VNLVQLLIQQFFFFFARNCFHKLITFISYGSSYVGVTGYFVIVFIHLETVYLYCKIVLTCSSLGCMALEVKAFGSFKMLVTLGWHGITAQKMWNFSSTVGWTSDLVWFLSCTSACSLVLVPFGFCFAIAMPSYCSSLHLR
jgi:cobalamin synthase